MWIISEDSLCTAVRKITFLLFIVYLTSVTTLLHIIIHAKLVSLDNKSHTFQVIEEIMQSRIKKYKEKQNLKIQLMSMSK